MWYPSYGDFSRCSWSPFTLLHLYHHDSRWTLPSPAWNSCLSTIPFLLEPLYIQERQWLFWNVCHSMLLPCLQPFYGIWAITTVIPVQDQQAWVVWFSSPTSKCLCALAFPSCTPPMLTLLLSLLFKHCKFAFSSAWNTFWQIWHSFSPHCHLLNQQGPSWMK